MAVDFPLMQKDNKATEILKHLTDQKGQKEGRI